MTRGPAHLQAATARCPAAGREAAADRAFSGRTWGAGGSDRCFVHGVVPVCSSGIGFKVAPRNVLGLAEDSFPSEQRFTRCVIPGAAPGRGRCVSAGPGFEECALAGSRFAGEMAQASQGLWHRAVRTRPGRAQQVAFPKRAHRGARGGRSRGPCFLTNALLPPQPRRRASGV